VVTIPNTVASGLPLNNAYFFEFRRKAAYFGLAPAPTLPHNTPPFFAHSLRTQFACLASREGAHDHI
jgi:hypothetical protein